MTNSGIAPFRETGCGLAWNCPENPAVYNARALVEILTGERIPDCPKDFGSKSLTIKSPSINSEISKETLLGDNFPDPFNDQTIVPCYLNEEQGKLIIRDVLGKIIYQEVIYKGWNEIIINTDKWSSGMYLYTLETDTEISETKKMILKR
jgi:hypothetical protein